MIFLRFLTYVMTATRCPVFKITVHKLVTRSVRTKGEFKGQLTEPIFPSFFISLKTFNNLILSFFSYEQIYIFFGNPQHSEVKPIFKNPSN